MLVFVDESGDLGFKFEQGSTQSFTMALVVFDTVESALSCQQSIEATRDKLELPACYEFHFHADSHQRRLAFLNAVTRQRFSCYAFTLGKMLLGAMRQDLGHRGTGYQWICRMALESMASDLQNAAVVMDGSGERGVRREIKAYLRRELNSGECTKLSDVRMGRSSSDPLIQLADYVAGVTNRLYEGKIGVEQYALYLRRKIRSQRKWP